MQHGLHKPYQPDRRWAHEGTLEYTSRDSHLGCFSRRGDMEVLLYNMIEWVGGKLPWEDVEQLKPPEIHSKKIHAFNDIESFFDSCFSGREYPTILKQLMKNIGELVFEEKPDYDWMKTTLTSEMNKNKDIFDEVELNIEMNLRSQEVGGHGDVQEKENEDPLLKRSGQKQHTKKGHSKKAKKAECISSVSYAKMKESVMKIQNEESLLNPTPAMTEQLEKMRGRGEIRIKKRSNNQ